MSSWGLESSRSVHGDERGMLRIRRGQGAAEVESGSDSGPSGGGGSSARAGGGGGGLARLGLRPSRRGTSFLFFFF